VGISSLGQTAFIASSRIDSKQVGPDEVKRATGRFSGPARSGADKGFCGAVLAQTAGIRTYNAPG
jgi:hypothetical protein